MKKAFLLFLLLVLVGCSQKENYDVYEWNPSNVDQVDVYEMKDSWEKIDDPLISFTDREVVDDFIKAIHKMKRLPGVVDVAAPDYLIDLNGKEFYLWIHPESGSIMDPEDTNTLYRLEETSAKEIYEVFKAKVKLQKNLSNEEVVKSLEKQGLELKQAEHDSDKTFGKLNGELPESYEVEGQPVYIYNFYSDIERQNGLEEWYAQPPMDQSELYQVFGVRNILIFHVYGEEMDADIHAKFVEGLKFIDAQVK